MAAPERIYLQWYEDEADKYMPEGVTWCQDQIDETDVEYVRADKAAAEMQEMRDILKIIANERFIPEEWERLTARVKAALGDR